MATLTSFAGMVYTYQQKLFRGTRNMSFAIIAIVLFSHPDAGTSIVSKPLVSLYR